MPGRMAGPEASQPLLRGLVLSLSSRLPARQVSVLFCPRLFGADRASEGENGVNQLSSSGFIATSRCMVAMARRAQPNPGC